MKLLVDIGNSRIKWATLDHERVSSAHTSGYSIADLDAIVSRAWAALPRPERILLCNVAGPVVGHALEHWTEQHWNRPPRNIVARARGYGIVNAYGWPHTLGADRWTALIGAHHHYPGPVCVVDCGTAITLDLIDADGIHQGGLIAPGPGMMANALTAGTHAIDATPSDYSPVLGHSTGECVAAGILYTVLGLIDAVMEHPSTASGPAPTLLLSGGAAVEVLPHIHRPHVHEPDLVLKGLACIARLET